MRAPERSSLRARRGFSFLELLISVIVIGIIATASASGIGSQVSKIRARAEGERLLSCLRLMRELARSKGPHWQYDGYGVYFWSNTTSGTCVQYSPWAAVIPNQPDFFGNTVSSFFNQGVPTSWNQQLTAPVTLGEMQPIDFQNLTPQTLSNGLQIIFQTDALNQPDYSPRSLPRFPAKFPPPFLRSDRFMFWAPGYQADQTKGNPWSQNYNVSIPESPNGKRCYNRIYILSPTDASMGANTSINNPLPGAPAGVEPMRLPVRIWVHPGTGEARLMADYERRDDGTW